MKFLTQISNRQKQHPAMDRFLPNPKLKLREQVGEVCRFRHYSHRTENAYWHWIKGFIQFHRRFPAGPSPGASAPPSPAPAGEGQWRHPREMGAPQVKSYLSHLASHKDVAVATQRQALNAIVFLYREVLNMELGAIGEIERPQRKAKVPLVLSKEEVRRVLAAVSPEYQLVCRLLYGAGMRLLECLRLRVKDVNLERNEIVIHDGKGGKDRVTMLPDTLKRELQQHLERVKLLHEQDLAKGFGAVQLPHALERKFQNANREWCWQFVFPAATISQDPTSGIRRHHLHEVSVQRAVKVAAGMARVNKPVTPHTFRKASS